MSNPFKSRNFKRGGLSVLFTVLFIAAVVLINIIAGLLLDRFSAPIDLTEGGTYSISDETVDYVKALTSDKVSITVTSKEDAFTGSGTYYAQTNEICKKFTQANSNITLSYVDLLSNPGFSSGYDETLAASQIIVRSENTDRYKILTYNDYLDVKYMYNGEEIDEQTAYYYQNYYGISVTTDVSGAAEQAILSAIMSVTNVDPVRVAYTTGYGESANDAMSELLEKNAYVIESLDITMSDEIDSDIDYVIIYAPTADYTNENITKLDKWLDNNGKFEKNLIYVPNVSTIDTPNLDAFLAEWGLKVEQGVTMQTDTNYCSPSNPFYQYLTYEDDASYTEGLNTAYKLITYSLRPVTTLWDEYSTLATKAILKTYAGNVIYPMDADKDWSPDGKETAQYNAVVESSKVRFESTTPFYSRVIVVGDPYFFNNTFLSQSSVNNADFMMNMFNTISGKEDGVTIQSKSFAATTFDITAGTANAIAIVFAIVLPILMIAMGIVVYVRRKHK